MKTERVSLYDPISQSEIQNCILVFPIPEAAEATKLILFPSQHVPDGNCAWPLWTVFIFSVDIRIMYSNEELIRELNHTDSWVLQTFFDNKNRSGIDIIDVGFVRGTTEPN